MGFREYIYEITKCRVFYTNVPEVFTLFTEFRVPSMCEFGEGCVGGRVSTGPPALDPG